ncbi:acyl transferase 9-like [Typha angustifolia]|uniref:acyl transferase 9-like n=1 Tax=Typha angustifolia TaxID=59011 RepID=UPI003C2EE035
MGFTVTRISEGPVRPAEPTPTGTLPLAWIDRYPTHRGLVESMHIFKQADEPAKVIREALAKALVLYYPLAGRIIEPVPGEPVVDCTADGVYFAEATANCSLEEVNYLERPLMLPKEELVPYPKKEDWEVEPANTIMMMQVTVFTCGGFVLGLRFNHASADGLGAAQFITAVGEMARGLPEPTVKPVWGREAFPNPKLKPGPLPELPVLALDYIVLDYTMDYLNQLKAQYMERSGKRCSGFDVIVAKLWQCRTQALNLDPEVDVKLCFFASVRHLLKLNKGYYGNSIFPIKMSVPSGKILSSTLMEVVDLIREAKEKMPAEFFKFANGELTEDPFGMTFNYESIYVSDWSKLGFAEVDYGWGPPMVAGPLVNNDFIASVVILKAPAPLEGLRMLASCVTKDHSKDFVRQMKNLA